MRRHLPLSLGAALLAVLGSHQLAWGSDQVICNSRTFNVSFAVGSDGYVTNMVLSDKSKRHFPGVLEIDDMAAGHRHLSIRRRSIDVQADVGQPAAKKFVVFMKGGKGYVKLDADREAMTCDWEI